jgi:hypothetical protein
MKDTEKRIRNSAFWTIIPEKNDNTREWWEAAHRMFRINAEVIPDCLHPLIDPDWNENEAIATSAAVRAAQAWATGVPGWSNTDSPLIFKK